METMEQLPDEFKGTIFEELWNKLDYYSLPIEDQVYYERVMKRRADERNILATAKEKGIEQGLEKGMQQGLEKGIQQGLEKGKLEEKLQIARNMKAMGASFDFIKQSTKLSDEEIQNL
jgi:predicted transposase/invertase (TIGR01784 family)